MIVKDSTKDTYMLAILIFITQLLNLRLFRKPIASMLCIMQELTTTSSPLSISFSLFDLKGALVDSVKEIFLH